MAESVDALVSNTSGAIHPGSIPGLGTKQAAKRLMFNRFAFFCQRIGNLAFLLDKLFYCILFGYIPKKPYLCACKDIQKPSSYAK